MSHSLPWRARGKRILAVAATCAIAAAGLHSTATAGDSVPPTGDQQLGSAQPRFFGYRVQDIRDWSPQSDPFAEHLRAEVPLQPRIQAPAATQAKPNLDGKAQIMLMQGDYGNSFFNTATYNNDYTEHTLNFWQYTDYYSPWHGAATVSTPPSLYDPKNSDWRNRGFEFGIVNIPNPAYTNAAHRNGVKSIGTIYFDSAFRPGLTFTEMFEKDPSSQGYIIANKLIEMARYYGFDGFFLNQEEVGSDPSEFKPLMAYLTSQGLWTQWYDTNSNFNEAKRAWLKDDTHGQIHNSVFVNYGWPWHINNILQHAADTGTDPYQELFLGVEANQAGFAGKHVSSRYLPYLYDAYGTNPSNSPQTSLALFTPSDHYQRGLDGDVTAPDGDRPPMQRPEYQWMIHERERMYFSGVTEDVLNTGTKPGFTRPDVGVKDASGWVGVADFTPARSVIGGSRFFSTFNTGHGMARWTSGTQTSTEQWGNINEQSILPSWQWWITGTDGQTAQPALTAAFDYGTLESRVDTNNGATTAPFSPVGAYDGGSSLAIYGELTDSATMRLFRTDLALKASSRVELVAKNVEGSATLSLAVISKDDPSNVQKVALAATGTDANGWTTYTADLSDRAGSTLSTLGVILEGQGKVQVNLGRLAVTDGASAPASPAGFTVEQVFTDGQANLSWEAANFADVDYYEVYARHTDGSVKALGGTYASRYYIKKLNLTSGPVSLELVAIGKDGQRSAPAHVAINPALGVSHVAVNVAPATEGATEQQLAVSWKGTEGADGYRAELSLLHTGCEAGKLAWTRTLTGSELSTAEDGTISSTLTVPYLEGRDYDLTLVPLKDGKEINGAQPIALRGSLADRWAEPLPASDVSVTRNRLKLRTPTARDWHVVTVSTKDGDDIFEATRGTGGLGVDTTNEILQKPISLAGALPEGNGTLTIRLTDYAGNVSDETVVTVTGGEATSIVAPEQVREQTCAPGTIEDPEDPKPSPEPSEKPSEQPSAKPSEPAEPTPSEQPSEQPSEKPSEPGTPDEPSMKPQDPNAPAPKDDSSEQPQGEMKSEDGKASEKKSGKKNAKTLAKTGVEALLGIGALTALGTGAGLLVRRKED